MTDIVKRMRAIVNAASEKLSPVEYVKQQVAAMERGEIEALAAAYLMSQVNGRLRRSTLVIERKADRSHREPRWGTAGWDEWAAQPEHAEAAERTLELRREYARIDAEASLEFQSAFKASLDLYAEKLRVQWTRDLLDAKFATGDGERVRWGEATKEQHEERARMHARNAQAGAEGYARHAQALEELERTGASCLYEAVERQSA